MEKNLRVHSEKMLGIAALGQQNTYATFSFGVILSLQPSNDKYCINCSSLKYKAMLHFINNLYFMKFFPHLHSILKKLHSYVPAAISDFTLPFGNWSH